MFTYIRLIYFQNELWFICYWKYCFLMFQLYLIDIIKQISIYAFPGPPGPGTLCLAKDMVTTRLQLTPRVVSIMAMRLYNIVYKFVSLL